MDELNTGIYVWSQLERTLILCAGNLAEVTWLKIIVHCENRAILGYYAADSGNFVPTFRDNLLIPSSGFKNWTLLEFWHLKMGSICYPKTSVRNYHHPLRNDPEERRSHFAAEAWNSGKRHIVCWNIEPYGIQLMTKHKHLYQWILRRNV
jgi:hypothetical protein